MVVKKDGKKAVVLMIDGSLGDLRGGMWQQEIVAVRRWQWQRNSRGLRDNSSRGIVVEERYREALKVTIDRKSMLYLYGTELQYSDGLNGKGFQWVNPNASRTCGCGESFAL